jgi:hypothetical protein
MLFEFLVGVLALDWRHWPSHIDNHGLMDSRVLTPSKFLCKTPIRHANRSCLKDTFVNGTRITYLWLDTAEEEQWRALDALELSTLAAPNAILASFGAWDAFLAGRRPDVKGYRLRVGRTLSRLDAMFQPNASFFGPLWTSPKKVFAALPTCASRDPKLLFHNALRLNPIAEAVVCERPGWTWFARDTLTVRPCHKADCLHGTFHPTGSSLNVITKLFLSHAVLLRPLYV